MAFLKKTVKDVDLKDTYVLLRADYNVPVKDGVITDNYRIKQSLPTVRYILEHGGKVVICSHLGRPKIANDSACSLKPVAAELAQQLQKEVVLIDNYLEDGAAAHIRNEANSKIVMLENLRFHPEEEGNNQEFAQKLAQCADIFVQDGFGVVHRKHASTDAITAYVPSVAGLLLEREVTAITESIEQPQRPLIAIVGGAKISDKIDVLEKLIDIADMVAVGGAMANTFLLARGITIGKSLAEPSEVPLAKDIMEKAAKKARNGKFVFYLPQDGVVAKTIDKTSKTRIVDWDAHVVASIAHYPKRPPKDSALVADDERILDIGPFSGAFIAGSIQLAGTVIWNGAMGVTETPALHDKVGPFSHGTQTIVDAMLGSFGHKPTAILGGGDTVGYVANNGIIDQFSHVSTGGGASLELMSGQQLPGVEALNNKE